MSFRKYLFKSPNADSDKLDDAVEGLEGSKKGDSIKQEEVTKGKPQYHKEWHLSDAFDSEDIIIEPEGDIPYDNYFLLALCLLVGWLVYVRQFGAGNNNNNNQNNANPPVNPVPQENDLPNNPPAPAEPFNRHLNPDPANGQM